MPRKKASVTKRNSFRQTSLQSDFSQATVITMFLLPEINLKLRPIDSESKTWYARRLEFL